MTTPLSKDLTDGERKFVEGVVGSFDQIIFMKWVNKMKRNKVQPRLIVISGYKFFSIKRGVNGKKHVQRSGHFYDLVKLISADPGYIRILFKTWDIEIVGEDRIADEIVKIIRIALRQITYGFPDDQIPQYDVPLERLLPMEPLEPTPGEGIIEIYRSFCNYYNTPPSDTFIQFVQNQCVGTTSKEIILDQCSGIELDSEYAFSLMPVMAALKNNSYFTSVLLRRVPRTDAVQIFAEPMKSNKTLEKIVFTDIEATEGFVELGEALKSNPNNALAHLDFSHNPMKDKGIIGLSGGFEKKTRGLKIINFSHCQIGVKGMATFMKTLSYNLPISCSLIELNLSHNDLQGNASHALATWISSMNGPEGKKGNLQKLFLANTNIDIFVVLQAIRNSVLDTLEVLDIADNKLEKIASQALVFVLENTSCLKSLVLSSCKITPEITFVLLSSASNNPKMKDLEIDLSNNDLGNDGGASIAKVLPTCTNIHTLKLQSNNFQKEAMVGILKALGENKTLKGIDLSFNLKSSNKNGEVFKAMFELLSRKTGLETLVFAGNEKTYLGKDLATVFPAFRSNVTLTALDISGNRMGDKAAIELCDALRVNGALSHLVWDENYVNLSGYQALASALKTNKRLSKMPLPVEDLDRAVDEAREKKRFKEKITEILNAIQQCMAFNRGEINAPPFMFPTPQDRRLSVRDPNRKPSPSVSAKDKPPSLTPPMRSSYDSIGSNASGTIMDYIPPPPPYPDDEETASQRGEDDELPPPPVPTPF